MSEQNGISKHEPGVGTPPPAAEQPSPVGAPPSAQTGVAEAPLVGTDRGGGGHGGHGGLPRGGRWAGQVPYGGWAYGRWAGDPFDAVPPAMPIESCTWGPTVQMTSELALIGRHAFELSGRYPAVGDMNGTLYLFAVQDGLLTARQCTGSGLMDGPPSAAPSPSAPPATGIPIKSMEPPGYLQGNTLPRPPAVIPEPPAIERPSPQRARRFANYERLRREHEMAAAAGTPLTHRFYLYRLDPGGWAPVAPNWLSFAAVQQWMTDPNATYGAYDQNMSWQPMS